MLDAMNWGSSRLGVGLLCGLALVMSVATPAQAVPAASVPVLVVSGRGFGHGVGMAQEGAYTMGMAGSTTAQILSQFYPGTTMGQARGAVRVPVLTAAGGGASVSFPSGGEIRSSMSGDQAPGFPMAVSPGEVVGLRYDGTFRASLLPGKEVVAQEAAGATIVQPPGAESVAEPQPLAPTPAVPPPTAPPLMPTPALPPPAPIPALPPPTPTPALPPRSPASTSTFIAAPSPQPGDGEVLASPSKSEPPARSPAVAGTELSSPTALFAVPAVGTTVALPARSARYRGVIEATMDGGSLRLVNELDVEDYLRGMGEVRDGRWPAAALGAQAVAARTYALRAVAGGGEICPTQRCQVYLGQQAEYPAMDAAVAATRGQVLRYGAGLATTVYSANGGGVTATPKEGFGPAATDLPYLRAVPYPTGEPDAWETRVGLADLAARLGYPSTLQSVRVSSTGPSGRATAVELSGGAGTRTLDARSFARALGLRSTLWSLSLGRAEVAPTPPAPAELVQVPPLEASLAVPTVLTVPPASQGRILDEPAPIVTTAGAPGTRDSGSPGQPLWALYALIFLVTASRRRLRGVWARPR
jgi:SpoIID/LytB domain protein